MIVSSSWSSLMTCSRNFQDLGGLRVYERCEDRLTLGVDVAALSQPAHSTRSE